MFFRFEVLLITIIMLIVLIIKLNLITVYYKKFFYEF